MERCVLTGKKEIKKGVYYPKAKTIYSISFASVGGMVIQVFLQAEEILRGIWRIWKQ